MRTRYFRIIGYGQYWYIEQKNDWMVFDTWTRHSVPHDTIAKAKKSIEELGGYLV